VRRCSANECIQASTIAILTLTLDPSIIVIWDVPNTLWLRGKDARASDLAAELAARRKRDIANHLGFHSKPWTPRQEPVVGISFQKCGRHPGSLAIRRRS